MGRTPRSWWLEQQEQPLSMRELQARLEAERSSLTISVREFHAQQVEVTGSLTRSVEQKFAGAMDAIDNLSKVTEGRIREAVSRLEARCGELEARNWASKAAKDLHQQLQPQPQSHWPGKAGTSVNLPLKGTLVDEKSPDLLEVYTVLKTVCGDIEQLQGQCCQLSTSFDTMQKQQSNLRQDLHSHLKNLVAQVQSQLSSDAWEIQNQITGDMSQLMGEVEALRDSHNNHSLELETVCTELKERCSEIGDAIGQHDQKSRKTDEVLARLLSNLEVKQKDDTNLEALRTQNHQEIELVRKASMSRQSNLAGTLQPDFKNEVLCLVQELQRQQSCNIDVFHCEGREYGNELREVSKQLRSEMERIRKAQQDNADNVSCKVEALQGKVTEDHQSLKASEVAQAQLGGTIRALKNNFKVLQIQQSRHTTEIEVLQTTLRRRSIAEPLAAG